jgi:hypothetical protein
MIGQTQAGASSLSLEVCYVQSTRAHLVGCGWVCQENG